MNAVTLFKHSEPSVEFVKALNATQTKSGSTSLGLLPCTAKDGKPSLASVFGLKGQALKRAKRQRQDELKTLMAKEFAGMASSNCFTGGRITMTASGCMGFRLDPTGEVPQKAIKDLTAEERETLRKQKMAELKELEQVDEEILKSLEAQKKLTPPTP